MNKVELLAPAGSFDALKAAVSAGADAVYLGGIRFGARAFASNFDEQTMMEAIQYCHIRQVKVYVTVNTLVYEHELDELRKTLQFLYDAHVDAVIVQDFGVFQILRTEFPDFEVHCSTQMHIHNKAGVQLMKKMGAGRVVLARETPIELIAECAKEEIELEVFVHGALCVCYSGQCLFSSFNGGRSGNRGECAQPCRKAYQLIDLDTQQKIHTDGEYLLSPKDLWTIDHVKELIEAGISSFKIEGRMKRPEYVYEIVRVYRKAIDDVYANQSPVILDEDRTSILKLFNRTMTTGHLFHNTGYNLLHPVRPNHMGIPLGRVLKTSKGKITIELTHDLHQNDGIRILSQHEDMGMLASRIVQAGRLVNGAKQGDVVDLETSLPIVCRKHDPILLTTDRLQCESIAKQMEKEKRFAVDMVFHAEIGKQAQLIIHDGHFSAEVFSSEIVQRALKQPVTSDKIQAQLSKLNDSIYYLRHFEQSGDFDLFLSLKTINEMRRQAVQLLDKKRLAFYRKPNTPLNTEFKKIHSVDGMIFDISMKEQLEALNHNQIFSSKIQDDRLFSKGHRVDERDIKLAGNMVMHTQIGTMKEEKKDQIWICDASLNATNSYAIEFLLKLGADAVIASLEANDEDIEAMIESFIDRHGFVPQVGKMVYGRRELMIMKACLINAALGNGKKTQCSLCRTHRYGLMNEKGHVFPIGQDGCCHPVIYDCELLKDYEFSDKISLIVLRFTDESSKQCKEIYKTYENIFR